jgi:glycosyltransferase involved in cell wall biosynthesis
MVVEGLAALKALRVLVLTKYGVLGASSRLRFLQYFPWLQQAGMQVTVQPLLSDQLLQKRYQNGRYGLWSLLKAYISRCHALLRRSQFDLVWIEKEALQWFPLWLELALLRGTPYVLDYDDAVFHHYDQHANPWVRRVYGRRLDGLMARAALVVAGNGYLARRAREAGAGRVEVIPTVIDLKRYGEQQGTASKQLFHDSRPRIVWIGSPSTACYLQLLTEPLQALSKRHAFVLRVIGGGAVDIPGVQVESLPWSEDTEVKNISECAIGVMPLLDTSWERGKCGYKLIQYMACGLPVVASSVGVNKEIVQQGENGYLADTPDEWFVALENLLQEEVLRQSMGRTGRQMVALTYCVQKTGPKLSELLVSIK